MKNATALKEINLQGVEHFIKDKYIGNGTNAEIFIQKNKKYVFDNILTLDSIGINDDNVLTLKGYDNIENLITYEINLSQAIQFDYCTYDTFKDLTEKLGFEYIQFFFTNQDPVCINFNNSKLDDKLCY